jgi:predicted Zn-dependent peptidase
MVVSIAGNIAGARAAEAIERAFAGLPAGAPQPLLASRGALPGPALVFEADDSEQANFCMGFPGLARRDPLRRALLALDTILGGGMSSRLVQEIREERGLAYSVGSLSREFHDAGKWIVYGSMDPARLDECIEATLAELRRTRADGVTAEELAQVKEQVKGGILLSLEDTWSVASRNGTHQLRDGRVKPIEEVVAEVEAVTAEEVLEAARRVLREEALHLAVIGPGDDAAALRDRLHL